MGAKNILIITGSPRAEGNTNNLVKAFAAAATGAGHTVKCFDAVAADMHGCHGDQNCFKTGRCGLKDDGLKMYELMGWADVLVLASPVYWKGFTSWIKRAIDRFYVYASPKGRENCSVKESYLIAAAGNPDVAVFDAMKQEFDLVNKLLQFRNAGELLAAGLKGPDDYKEHMEYIQAAAEMGSKVGAEDAMSKVAFQGAHMSLRDLWKTM